MLSAMYQTVAMESGNQSTIESIQNKKLEKVLKDLTSDGLTTQITVLECRICKEEDLQINVEAPCSCRGTLQYAHRDCIQIWCDAKGDTTCEICHQEFKPNYTVRGPLTQLERFLAVRIPYVPAYSRPVTAPPLHQYGGSSSAINRAIQHARIQSEIRRNLQRARNLEEGDVFHDPCPICFPIAFLLLVLIVIFINSF